MSSAVFLIGNRPVEAFFNTFAKQFIRLFGRVYAHVSGCVKVTFRCRHFVDSMFGKSCLSQL
jgi:hypothetical protein